MTTKTEVICENLSKNPKCAHGPTLLYVIKRYDYPRIFCKKDDDTDVSQDVSELEETDTELSENDSEFLPQYVKLVENDSDISESDILSDTEQLENVTDLSGNITELSENVTELPENITELSGSVSNSNYDSSSETDAAHIEKYSELSPKDTTLSESITTTENDSTLSENDTIRSVSDSILSENGTPPSEQHTDFSSATYTIEKEYYACSAYRDLRGCNFYMKKCDYKGNAEEPELLFDIKKIKELRDEFFAMKPELRSYCHKCNVPFAYAKHQKQHAHHEKLIGISDNCLNNPTTFLYPLSNDKAEAQYFFKKNTLDFFEHNLKKLKITKIVCIGTPRLHEFIKSKYDELNIQSILLDIDHRLFYFNKDSEFIYYNMFNHHFFEGEEKLKEFNKFLKVNKDESLLIITDPPFGCRSEPLINTLKELTISFHDINNFNCILPIFWIFPYFMAHYIHNFMPEMNMIDYKINYTNHELYSDSSKGRKYGSPVRLFTNIPIDKVELPESEGYKFCKRCCKWTSSENLHCDLCRECPSKNGETYRHCPLCALCVKPKYLHCMNCQRCTQQENHNCEEYKNNINCWICRKRGHLELNCDVWAKRIEILNTERFRKMARHNFENGNIVNGKRVCSLCSRIGHNELKCPMRDVLLGDIE